MYENESKRSNKICSVPTCSVKPGDGISFHKFPKDEKYRSLWARLFHMRVLTKNDCVCNFHFEPSCFFRGSIDLASSSKQRRKLKKDAVPTLNLPDKNYYQTYSAKKKELRKIKRIRQWRVKKNKDIENVHPLIKNPPEIEDLEVGIDPLGDDVTIEEAIEESEEEGERHYSVVMKDDGESDVECEIYPLEIESTADSSDDMNSPTERKNSGSYCSVPSCSTYGGYNIPLHLFPKDANLANKWKEILKINKPLSPYMFVCGKHFISSDYLPTGQKRRTLKKIAVPSRNLPMISRESSNIQQKVNDAAEEHVKLVLRCLPKDPQVKHECLLKLQSQISSLTYSPPTQILEEHTEKSFESVQKRLDQIKSQMNTANSERNNIEDLIDLTYEEIQCKEMEESEVEESHSEDLGDNLRMEVEKLTAEKTKSSSQFPSIVKRRVSDQELVRCFLTNATLIKKFFKTEEQLTKYLDTAEEVKRGISCYTESLSIPLRRTIDRSDPCTVFGDFVANKLRLMTCLENRKQFKDWIHQGLKIIERTS